MRLPLAIALLSWPSFALQPLNAFVTSALDRNPDVLEAKANALQQGAQADVALGHVLPGIAARGSYTRNQYDSILDLTAFGAGVTTIVPLNQWDAAATVTVPLIDAAGWARTSAAKTSAQSADLQLAAARLAMEAQVAQDYYQLVANLAVAAAARQALDASQENLRLTRNRVEAGVAQGLDADRAVADVEAQNQQVSNAELQVLLAARALESTSGLAPDASQVMALADDLHAEPPLPSFEDAFERLPSVAASAAGTEAADEQARVQRFSLLPSLSGSFAEHGTTASGFVGHDWTWQAVLALSWNLDLTSFAGIRSQDAAADAARAREQRTRLAAHDAIYREWQSVAAGIARSRSARAGQAAAAHAAQQARDRYEAGTVVQLDLLQAQRDAFAAEVARIQADADLINARAQLRLAAGHPLTERSLQ